MPEVQKPVLEYAAPECGRREEKQEGAMILDLYGEDGRKVRAYTSQEYSDVSHMQGSGVIPGMASVRLGDSDSTPLNFVDENTFENPVTGELLTRTPPKPR